MQQVYKEGLHEQTTKFLNGDFIALDLKNLKVDKVVEICKLLYDISQKAVVIGAAD
ncbi:hypothetical protein [Clostridium zeae]|nr:hypothetical protein [Clostridium zeae]